MKRDGYCVDILKDIADFVKDDKEHNVRVEIGFTGVTVYLDYDPEHEYEENMMIPICYDALEKFTYIPQDELIEKYNPNDFGMDINEIRIIEKIMTYFEEHRSYIDELCAKYCAENREDEELSSLEDEVKAGLIC